jgi:phosphatidylglycerol---prolipoprotein diacylglyceryl transferase
MTVTWRMLYAVVMILAVVASFRLMQTRKKRLKLTRSQRYLIGIAAFLGSMLGAKVPFLGDAGWDGVYSGTVWFADGKTILGGIVGGYAAVELAKWIGNIRTRTGDAFALPVAVAVAIGRVGCFVAGCCYGRVTAMPWGVRFPLAQDAAGIVRHPTQLYELAFHSAAVLALLVMDRKRWFVDNQLKAYLISYMVYRFFSEWLRPESPVWLNLSAYQLSSVVIAAILIMLWVRDGRYGVSKIGESNVGKVVVNE